MNHYLLCCPFQIWLLHLGENLQLKPIFPRRNGRSLRKICFLIFWANQNLHFGQFFNQIFKTSFGFVKINRLWWKQFFFPIHSILTKIQYTFVQKNANILNRLQKKLAEFNSLGTQNPTPELANWSAFWANFGISG